jgi:hypothetical protein
MLRRVPTHRSLATFALSITLACTSEPHADAQGSGAAAAQGLPAPAQTEAPPPSQPTPPPASEVAPPPPPAPDPELDARKAALADVGKSAFEALQAGDFAALRKLTALDDDSLLRAACPRVLLGDPTELEAKFAYCHRQIAWPDVAEAQVFAPKPTGEPAAGCEQGFEDYGRLQLYLHMSDAKIWRVDFYGAVGVNGKAIGVDGSVSCKQVDEAPPL